MRFPGILLLSVFGLECAAAEPEPLRAFVQQAVDNYFKSLESTRSMTYRRRIERREFDGNGNLQKRSCWTTVAEYVEGVRWNYTIERDDKPLSDLSAVQSKVKRDVADWKSRTPEQRRKVLEEAKKRGRNETEYLREFAQALEFTPAVAETREGRIMRVLSFVPRPGYKPKALEGRVYEGVRGRIWIDEDERQLARLEAEVFRDVSVGGFLARVEKGTRFELDQLRVEPGVWAARRHVVRFDLKLLLVKQIHNQIESQFREYRRHTGPVFAGE
jgi:hypothetical protein